MDHKHYIQIDSKKNILRGFSNAFEQPKNGDIFIHEGGRHFEIDGVINPPLTTYDGIPLYKFLSGEISVKTQEVIEKERQLI